MRNAILVILAVAICWTTTVILVVPEAQRLGFAGIVAGGALLAIGFFGETIHERLGGFVGVALTVGGLVLALRSGLPDIRHSVPLVFLSSFGGMLLGMAVLLWSGSARRRTAP